MPPPPLAAWHPTQFILLKYVMPRVAELGSCAIGFSMGGAFPAPPGCSVDTGVLSSASALPAVDCRTCCCPMKSLPRLCVGGVEAPWSALGGAAGASAPWSTLVGGAGGDCVCAAAVPITAERPAIIAAARAM